MKKICLLLLLAVATIQAATAKELRVLTMNVLNSIQHGGWEDKSWKNSGGSRSDMVVKVILETKADIICIQEYLHNNDWLKDKLEKVTSQKWYIRVLPRNCAIISKYPIVPHGNLFRTPVQVGPKSVIDVLSTHMFVDVYIPYLILKPNVDVAKAIEQTQRANHNYYWKAACAELQASIKQSEATIVTGDFNEPSHLDYTKKAVAKGLVPCELYGMMSNYIIDTLLMKDAWHEYRKMQKQDECSLRGMTWSPTTWDYKPLSDDQRIDFIYYTSKKERLTLKKSLLVGETPIKQVPLDKVDVQVNPWPSDHRAVLAIFEYQE